LRSFLGDLAIQPWHGGRGDEAVGGGRVPTPYNEDFLYWWRRQVIALDDYPYEGIDFRGDPDMPLPPGSAYGDIGMSKSFYIFHFFVFLYN
jgi:hypothetical protein